MPKKVLIILVVLAVLGAGGYFGWRIYQTQQAQKAATEYAASSDKVADSLVRDLISQNVDDAYNNLYSSSLKTDYSKDHWTKTFFPQFKNYAGQPTRHTKESVQTPTGQIPTYNPTLNENPTRYEYDFTLHSLTYRVTFVIYKTNNQWKVNELSGAYLP